MSLSPNVIWEVRPATGADTNGGAFDPSVSSPGTDYSQQDSAQFSGTDGVTVGTSTFTSASHSFVSTDVGNMICISAGSGNTAGFYTVVSVSAGTATLDRSPGTGTGATWALGGALASVGILFNRSPGSGYNPNPSYGGIIYLKGTLSLNSSTYIQPQFGGPSDFSLIGYGTTRGDNVQATITINSNNPCWQFSNTSGRFYNISFTTTSGTPNLAISFTSVGHMLLCDNCTFNGFSVALISNEIDQLFCINCSFLNCTNNISGAIDATGGIYIFGCLFSGNAGGGFHNGGTSQYCTVHVVDSVFYNNLYGIWSAGDGNWDAKQGVYCTNCAFVDNTSDGIRNFGTGTNYAQLTFVVNCIFYGNGGYGVNVVTGLTPPQYVGGRNNAYGSNTNGSYTSAFSALPGDISLTANPFTSPSGGNFVLNNTSGGGAACKAAGFQSTLLT
jgi:hypothetical protein